MRRSRPARLLVLLLAVCAPACRGRARSVSRLPLPLAESENVTISSDTRPGVWLSPGDVMEWDLPAGPARPMRGAYESSLAGAEPGSLEISLTAAEKGSTRTLSREIVPVVADAGRWRAWSADLPRARGPVRLAIAYRNPSPGAASRTLFLATPELEATARGRPRTIVLLLIDTLRADRLSAYGYDRPTTPRIDAFFRGGMRADACLPAGNWTLPSHASLLTSTSVARHGVGRYGHVLPEGLETLAGSFAAAGYRTLAVTGGGYIDPSFGFARGFDRYTVVTGRAALAVEAALGQIRESRGESVFLFLHTYQVHDYAPDEAAARALFPETAVLGPDWQGSIGVLSRTRMSDVRLTGWVSARYDAALRSVDDAFGALLSGLEGAGRLEDAGILLTSDHGEALCDRSFRGDCLEWGHGSPYLFDEELRVPLLARFPWRRDAAARLAGLTTLLDVGPTLLAAAGIPVPASFEGRSLLAGTPPGRAVATEAPPHDAVALHQDRRKLIRRTGAAQPSLFDPAVSYYRMPPEECFDLAADPGERSPVACASAGDAPLPMLTDRYVASSFPGALVVRVPPRPDGEGRFAAVVRARGKSAAPGVRTFGLATPAELTQRGAVTEARFSVGLAPVFLGIEPLDGSQALEIETEGLAPLSGAGGQALASGDYRWSELSWSSGRDLPAGVTLFTTPPGPRLPAASPALSSEVAARLLALGYLRGAPALSGKIDPAASSSGASDLSPGQLRILHAR